LFTFNKGFLEKVWPARVGSFSVKQGYLWQKDEILGSNNIAITASGSCITQGSAVSNQTSSYDIVLITAEGTSSLASSSKDRVPNTIERKGFVLNKGTLTKSWTGNKGFVLKQGVLWQNIEPEQPETVVCIAKESAHTLGKAPVEQYHFSKTKHICTARGASVTYGNAETYKFISTFTPPGRLFFKDGLLHRYTSGSPHYDISFAFDNGLLYKSELLKKEHPVKVIVLGASGQATTVGTADLSYWEIPKLVATAAGHATTDCAPIDARIPHWTTAIGHASTSAVVSEPQIIGYTKAQGLIVSSGSANLNAIYNIKAAGHIFPGTIERGKDDQNYPTTWNYVSTAGNDSTGDGTSEKPYKTVAKALQSASSGHGIRILPGNYRLSPIVLSTLEVVGLYDYGKKLYIEGYDNETVLSFYGSDSSERDANLMQINNSGTIVSNITFHYYPNRGTNYSNAVFRWVYGRVRNCWIENKSSSTSISMHYHNDSADGTLKVYNCIVKSNGRISDDYYDQTGSPLYVNCLFDFTPSMGTRQYCVIRAITANDWNLAELPSDIRNMGDQSISNPNLTRSHIGVCGGPYGWGYYSRSIALLNIKHEVTSLSGKATTSSNKAETAIVQNQLISIRASAYITTSGRAFTGRNFVLTASGRIRTVPRKASIYKKYTLSASAHCQTTNWWTHRATASGHTNTAGLLSGGQLFHCEIVSANLHIQFHVNNPAAQTVLPCTSKSVSRTSGNVHVNCFFSIRSTTGKSTTSKRSAPSTIYRIFPITSITGHARTNGRARIPPPNEHVVRSSGRIRTYPYCTVDMDYYLYIIGFRRVHWTPTNGTSYYNVYRSDSPGGTYYKMGTAPHQKRPNYKIPMDLKPRNLTAARTSEGVIIKWQDPLIDGYPITIKPVPVGSDQQEKYSPSQDTAWVNDSLPEGASWIDQTGLEVSNFMYHGESSFKLTANSCSIEPKFVGANNTIPEGYIIVWVYIDKDNVPDSFWFSFYDNDWEHCYYWCKNKRTHGEMGSPSKIFIEEFPTPGLWTPIIFDTEGINTSAISGMSFGVNKSEGTGIMYVDSVYYTNQYVTKVDFPHIGLNPEQTYVVKKSNSVVKLTSLKEFEDHNVTNVFGFTNKSNMPSYSFNRDPIEDKVIITWGVPTSSGTTYNYSVASIDMMGVQSQFVNTSIVLSDTYDHTDITISSQNTPQFTITVTNPIYEHNDVIVGELYHYKFETKDSDNNVLSVVEIDYQVPPGSVLGNFVLGRSVLA
jgi:hypothetical protein